MSGQRLRTVVADTNALIRLTVLQGLQIVPPPRFIVDYGRNGHLSHEAARTLLAIISPHRSLRSRITQLRVHERQDHRRDTAFPVE